MLLKKSKCLLVSTLVALAALASNTGAEPRESATFSLGEEEYALDFVLCYREPDSSTRIFLGDVEARTEFPSIGIWLRADETNGEKPQVFSADFYRAKPQLKWRFDSGRFDLSERRFVASGVMNGTLLDRNAERWMTPLGEDRNQKFSLEVTCNDY